MARYFFDIDDGVQNTIDDEGIECEDDSHAKNQAVAVLPAIAKDHLSAGADTNMRAFVVAVRDQSGRQIVRAKLALTLES